MLTQRSNVMLSEVEASKNHIKIDPSYRQDDNFAKKTNLGSTSILLPFFILIAWHLCDSAGLWKIILSLCFDKWEKYTTFANVKFCENTGVCL